jgi:tRNA/rRNA methyltransferase
METFENISVLLVETQSAGNIGSVARAMKNFGLRRLVLVDCRTELTDEARHMACGADDLLSQSAWFFSLQEALEGFDLSIGTSSRSVQWIPTVLNPAGMADQALPLARERKIALVFGPERTGLTNEHLRFCQWLVTIPTSAEFESMNLSHAVAVLAYELAIRAKAAALGRSLDLAPLKQIEGFYRHLGECLHESGFLDELRDPRIMATLRQVFSRAALERRDVRILRGILRQWSWYAGELKKNQ